MYKTLVPINYSSNQTAIFEAFPLIKKFGNSFIQIQHAQIRLKDIPKHFYSHS